MPPTLLILLNNSLISLPAQGFPVFLKFCVAVHLRHSLCDNSDFQPRGSIVERRHFTKQDEISAMCNQCNAISCKGANTSNMLKHLSYQHGIKHQECHVFDRLSTSAKLASTVALILIKTYQFPSLRLTVSNQVNRVDDVFKSAFFGQQPSPLWTCKFTQTVLIFSTFFNFLNQKHHKTYFTLST